MTVRVVFDSNIFDVENFEALEKSLLLTLFRKRRVVPVYGHVFVEETLRAYGAAGKRDFLANRWLPFIVATCDSICNDFNGIFHEELVRGRGPHARRLMARRDYERFKTWMPKIPLDGTWRVWHASKAERDIEDGKRAAQREVSKDIRAEVADWKKAVGYQPNKHGVPDFARYIRTEIDHAGRAFVGSLVQANDKPAIADRWARNKPFYPYFTEFVFDMLYMAYYSMTKPSAPIDLNAQADLNVMAHLLQAEVLVSNEKGFLRTAFEEIWKPRGKVLMTGPEFLQYLSKF
ncbi:MAG: hypothetical protein ACRENK_11935 [Gemmatimonadaceae bacterium]